MDARLPYIRRIRYWIQLLVFINVLWPARRYYAMEQLRDYTVVLKKLILLSWEEQEGWKFKPEETAPGINAT